ncbi:MAG: exostosin family protein [Nibricoccus sp.]
MKIYVTSCETGQGAWRHQEELLKGLWQISSRRHSLCDSPDEADFIVIGNLREENGYQSLRENPLVTRFANKCFAISETDEPFPLLRGVYTSAYRGLYTLSRFRSGAYNLYHPDFRNPHVERHPGDAFNQTKKYLYSFVGRRCHPVRERFLACGTRRPDVLIQDTSHFNLFTHDQNGKDAQQLEFTRIVESSKFVLCPRGNGAASIRLFEAMKMGVAPVIISDDWLLPRGPNWAEFALFIREKDIDRLDEIVSGHEGRFQRMGQKAAEAHARFFADDVYFDFLVEQLRDIRDHQVIPEAFFWKVRNALAFWARLKNAARRRISVQPAEQRKAKTPVDSALQTSSSTEASTP